MKVTLFERDKMEARLRTSGITGEVGDKIIPILLRDAGKTIRAVKVVELIFSSFTKVVDGETTHTILHSFIHICINAIVVGEDPAAEVKRIHALIVERARRKVALNEYDHALRRLEERAAQVMPPYPL